MDEELNLTALVVYESFVGNSESIARAVAGGLRLEGLTAEAVDVSDAHEVDVEAYDLLVVGGPTHSFSLSRSSTRDNAVARGGDSHYSQRGLREWLSDIPIRDGTHLAAAFDTRVSQVRRFPLSAARAAARILRQRRFILMDQPQGFVMEDTAGPLAQNEMERAIAWARSIAREAQARSVAVRGGATALSSMATARVAGARTRWSRTRGVARRHPLRTYVVLAYVASWSCWLPLVVTGSQVTHGSGWPTDLPGLAGPATAAAVTSWLVGGRAALRDLLHRAVSRRCPAWCWWYVGATAALGALVAVVSSGGRIGNGWSSYTGAPDLGMVATFLLVFLVNGFGEETGWRGYLVHHLSRERDLRHTALLVGIVWAGWHLPLFLVVESFRGLGIAMVGWFIGLLAGSVLLTWLYLRSRSSILLVALWHTTFNFMSGTSRMSGAPAAVSSTAVMVLAVAILVREGRASDARRITDS